MVTNVLTKELAAEQDILLGIGQVVQVRSSLDTTVDRLTMIKPLATLAELQALDVTDADNFYPYATTAGGAAAGDNGGYTWWFDIAEPIINNNGTTIIAGNGATVGCWKQLVIKTPIRGITVGRTTNYTATSLDIIPMTGLVGGFDSDESMWAVGNPERIVQPANSKRIKLYATISTGETSAEVYIRFTKNGSAIGLVGNAEAQNTSGVSGPKVLSIASHPIASIPTDYFGVQVEFSGGGTLTLIGGTGHPFVTLSMEVLE